MKRRMCVSRCCCGGPAPRCTENHETSHSDDFSSVDPGWVFANAGSTLAISGGTMNVIAARQLGRARRITTIDQGIDSGFEMFCDFNWTTPTGMLPVHNLYLGIGTNTLGLGPSPYIRVSSTILTTGANFAYRTGQVANTVVPGIVPVSGDRFGFRGNFVGTTLEVDFYHNGVVVASSTITGADSDVLCEVYQGIEMAMANSPDTLEADNYDFTTF